MAAGLASGGGTIEMDRNSLDCDVVGLATFFGLTAAVGGALVVAGLPII
jgi:hypothetical protein